MPDVTPLGADDFRHVGGYQLTGRVAGGPAPVYLARSVRGEEVTLTLLGSEWTGGAARDRFAAEAAAARRVAPFCAARIIDAGVHAGEAYLVSEYVPGPSLLEVVARQGPRAGTELEALAIGSATGLAAIHQAGLVHGDFGPDRVILSPEGPRVVDFGITPPYGTATPAADMLAWAHTIVFAAAGSPPERTTDAAVLPYALRQPVTDCLSAQPSDRPAARAVVQELLAEQDPPAGLLAEAARRARGAYAAAQAPRATGTVPSRPRPVSHGGRAGPGPAGGRAGPGDHSSPGGGVSRGSRGQRTLALLGAVVAGVLVVLLAARIVQNARGRHGAVPRPPSGAGLSAPVARSPSPSARPDGTPAPPAIPPALAGTWAGRVTQANPADVFSARVSLAAGTPTGTVFYSGASFSCSGRLSAQSADRGTLKLRQFIVSGRTTCADGQVTLRNTGPGAIAFTFRGKAGPAASGTLTKR